MNLCVLEIPRPMKCLAMPRVPCPSCSRDGRLSVAVPGALAGSVSAGFERDERPEGQGPKMACSASAAMRSSASILLASLPARFADVTAVRHFSSMGTMGMIWSVHSFERR